MALLLPDTAAGLARLKEALLSPDKQLLSRVLKHEKPRCYWIQYTLSSGNVLPRYIKTLYKAVSLSDDPEKGVNWYQFYDVWARGGYCALFEALCKIRAQPKSLVRNLLAGSHFPARNVLQWCQCCCAKLFADPWIDADLFANMDNLMYMFAARDRLGPLPDWLVKLIPRTKFSTMVKRFSGAQCQMYLRHIAADRAGKASFIREIVPAGDPRELVPSLRKLAVTIDFALAVNVFWHCNTMYEALKADPEWPIYIRVTESDARNYAERIPPLAAHLEPVDVCAQDALHWTNKEAASAAAAVLEATSAKRILRDKTCLQYVLYRSGLPLLVRRLAGEVAVHLLLFGRRKGLWSKLDPWLVRHIVSFYK